MKEVSNMRKTITFAFIIFIFLQLLPTKNMACPKSERLTPSANQLVIRVVKGGWGDAEVKDIEAVLYSTARDLLKYLPNRRLKPIIVEYDEDGPVTLYRKGPNGEYIIQLDVRGRYWAQLAYQFSHELCHVLSNYENLRVSENPNQWFEEALGETASLFTLRQMATTWKTSPPYPNWKSYAPSLFRYAEDRRTQNGRQLPSNMTLAQWYRANREKLRADYSLRDKNAVVADQLLPLFEQYPQNWEAVSYLNRGEPDTTHSFEKYLNNWYLHAPEKRKGFISKVINMFRR